MKLGELKEHLDGLDPELEVQIRIAPATDGDYTGSVDEFFGDFCEITDERNILVEYGKLTIVGDYEEYDEE